jgi:hypothetical protein
VTPSQQADHFLEHGFFMKTASIRLYLCTGLAGLMLMAAVPASAQYKPRPLNDPATGEKFHIEAGASFWNPSADLTVSSAGTGSLTGIAGTEINAKRDLGFEDKRLPSLELFLRPAAAHKFRLQYIPIKFEANATLQRDIVFNGIRYRLGIPVNSTLDWKAYRFGYEYDFIRKNRGYAGFILEAKYTDVNVALKSPLLAEFAHARAPIPALGGIFRVYVVPNISVTGEITGFKLPDSIDERYKAHYVDMDFYGTINLTDNVGFKGGYRSMDLGYLVKQDTGSFVMKGIYFGVVARY